jgi:SAM-dependent methyltransferase
MRYTARAGRNNLQQAFNFYRYVYSVCKLSQVNEPRILDFGGGWGRISRFFLRDTKPELIYIVDCLNDAIYRLYATGNPCKILKNQPLPPIVGLDTNFDLIRAFSVFSHLSEQYLHTWLSYLMDCLRPGGYLVFTTRGRQFIDQLEQVHREPLSIHSYLREKLPSPQEVRERYLKGEFQFYPTGGGEELTSDFYGEALIPRRYIEINYGSALVDFTEEVPDVDQAAVVLRRQEANKSLGIS